MANNEEVLNRLRAEQRRINSAINTVTDMERNGDHYKDTDITQILAGVTSDFAADEVISAWDGTKAPAE